MTPFKKNSFKIEFSFKTKRGPETFACFTLGDNPAVAQAIFKQVKNAVTDGVEAVMTVDFLETKNELPVNLDMINCTLDQLGEICKIITKEMFKTLQPE